MPKNTFYNLPETKRQRILDVLEYEFKTKPFQEVSIKTIVEKLKIPRGSFYQYFENLEDSYFTILDKKTIDIHILFMKTCMDKKFDIYKSLINFGEEISNILFHENCYEIYKNRYLYWNEDLNKHWSQYIKDYKIFDDININNEIDIEKINFIKAVIHDLIKRIFQENWNKEEFLITYKKHINLIKKGVD